ncbi:hypothetical protein ScPMuIL_017870 [Solemya velum]
MDQIIRRELDFEINDSFFWTDSMIVLGYIRNETKRYHTFVANRVATIQEYTSSKQWKHVFSKDNPADDVSRGLNVDHMRTREGWTRGPQFLWRNETTWTSPDQEFLIPNDDKEVKSNVISSGGMHVDPIGRIIEKYSSCKSLFLISSFKELKTTDTWKMLRASLLLWPVLTALVKAKPPHIVFIVADDLGWNDLGFRNPDMITPNIDKLAVGGVILNQSYVQPVCSPSRHAFMTGYYPFKAGLQHMVIFHGQAVCSPTNMAFLPQQLKKLGYATHAVGKWHLGFCNWNCTPTYRGFDSFFGYYNSKEDYYTHELVGYLDLHDNKQPDFDYKGNYSTDVFAKRAVDIINRHDADTPLFLYLPFQAVHEPIEVPKYWENFYPNIKTVGRRQFCGMVTAMDNAIGEVVGVLKQRGLYEDTLIVFTSDNGGWPQRHGNNWPLRGGKITIWEGGTRVSAFVHGAGLQKTGYTYDGMIHAVDWHPTILSAAGGTPAEGIDGLNQWPSISTGSKSARSEFIYNLDDCLPAQQGRAAIRIGDYKLMVGNPGLYSDWYRPEQITDHVSEDDAPCKAKGRLAKEEIVRLYNLKDDPTEHFNLASALPDVVEKLLARMMYYHKQMVPAKYPAVSPSSDPKYFNNTWSPGWC